MNPSSRGRRASVGGGCINTAVTLCDGDRCYFVKLNGSLEADMFEAEAEGLTEMASAEAIRVPAPLGTGSDAHEAWIVMEYIAMGRPRGDSQAEAGPPARNHASAHRGRLRLASSQHHRVHGSRQRLDSRLDRVLARSSPGFQLELAARNG